METVIVKGKGPRAQRLLDELEVGAKGLAKQAGSTSKGTVERRYLVDAPSVDDATKLVRTALGKAASEFDIS